MQSSDICSRTILDCGDGASTEVLERSDGRAFFMPCRYGENT